MSELERKLSGAEIILEVLKEKKVDTIFGYPGGTVIHVYDALYKNDCNIRHILTSHEQGAAHAADGYARSTGKTGVCLVTSGPGATNLVTGIATAYMDSVPLVAITINVSTESLGKDSFQEVDIAGIVIPVTKHSFIIKSIDKLAATLRRAFDIASTGRPGPVLVDITYDVTVAEAEYAPEISQTEKKILPGDKEKAELKRAAALLKKAQKPVLLVGGGAVISKAQRELIRFVEKYPCPVTDTLMGKGAFPGDRAEYMGMAGIYGGEIANRLLKEADVILAAGTRFSERVTGKNGDFAPNAKIIQIDIDKAELNKNIPIELGICADVSDALKYLNSLFKTAPKQGGYLCELIAEKKSAGKSNAGLLKDGILNGPLIVESVYRLTKGDAIVATEVGQNQMWAANGFGFLSEGQLLTSGGLGTMGYGLSAAIGAAIGNPERRIVNFAGDGCFRMNINELMTASRYRLPIIEIIINNQALGMVRQMQSEECDSRFSQTIYEDRPDFAAAAQALGAEACTVSDIKAFENAFKKALKVKDRPVVIVCNIPQEDVVINYEI